MTNAARARRLIGGAEYITSAVTNPPSIPPNLVSIESGRQSIGNVDLAEQVGPYEDFLVHTTYDTVAGDAGGARWQWKGSETTDGDDWLGSEPLGRWKRVVDPEGGGGGGGLAPGSCSITISGNGTLGVTVGMTNDDYLRSNRIELNVTGGVRTLYGALAITASGSMDPNKTYVNTGTHAAIIEHNSASVAGGNQNKFSLPTSEGTSYTLDPGQTLSFGGGYDYVAQLWKKPEDADALVDGLLVSELSAIKGRRDGEVRQTIGKTTPDDGGGGPWAWVDGGQALYIEDGWSVIYASGSTGCWQRVRDSDEVNICWLGCTDDGSVECGSIINDFCQTWVDERGTNCSLTLFVPNARARCRSVTTTNSSVTVTTASTAGLHVGQRIFGAGASGNIIATVGVGSFTLGVPAVASGTVVARVSPWGYRLGEGLKSADRLVLTLRGEGEPAFDSFTPFSSDTSDVTRGGPIFVVDADIHGIWQGAADDDPTSVLLLWRVENIGLLGPGGNATTGHGIHATVGSGNMQMSSRGVRCAGFAVGFYAGATITGLSHVEMKNHGNLINFQLGNGVTGPANVVFEDCDSQLSDIGLQVWRCHNCAWNGGLIQANNRHIFFGDTDSGGDLAIVGGLLFAKKLHLETENMYSGGHQPIEFSAVAGSTYVVDFNEVFGASISSPTLTIVDGVWSFINCGLGSYLNCGAGVSVHLQSPYALFGFSNIAVAEETRVTGVWPEYPGGFGFISGDYDHNWATQGPHASITIVGDTVIKAPTNAGRGARVRYLVRQDGTGSRRMTLGAGVYGTLHNLGCEVPSLFTSFELTLYAAGTWLMTTPQRGYTDHDPVEVMTAATTQTQGQKPITRKISHVTVVANANDVVTLPQAEAGLEVIVINDGANTLQVFPASGDDLGAGTNTSTTQAAGTNKRYVGLSATKWEQF
jgi:hypothetical protein